MKAKNIILGLLLFTFLFSNYSCNKKDSCETCARNLNSLITLNFENPVQNLNYPNTEIYISEDGKMQAGVINISKFEYSKFNQVINSLSENPEQTLQTVLYLNQFVTPSNTLKVENIYAFSRITLRNNLLFHEFYLRENNAFVAEETLTTALPFITIDNIESILTKIVLPKQSYTSYIIVSDNEPPKYEPKNNINILQKKIKRYLKSKIGNASRNEVEMENLEPNDSKCKTTLCKDDHALSECRSLIGGGYKCMGKLIIICRANFIDSVLTAASEMNSDSLNSIFDSSLHYGIKNEILSLTDFGRKYIDYYTDLSLIYDNENDPNIPLMLSTARLLYSMNNNFRNLKNYSTNGESIFINTETKYKILDIIASYKSVYNDAYSETIFQDIINDLNWAENKPISEIILRFLNN